MVGLGGLEPPTSPLSVLRSPVSECHSSRYLQFIERHGKRIPLHGGMIFNRISLTLKTGVGYTEPMGSADSYIQVVTFDDGGPVADILLVHSQSGDPDSPWYADQEELYDKKRWVRAPFTASEITQKAIAPPIVLTAPVFSGSPQEELPKPVHWGNRTSGRIQMEMLFATAGRSTSLSDAL
jgi:hypothetical protein